MKRFLQSFMGLLGFNWMFLTTLNSTDNLWCEFIWCPGEKWAQCPFRKFLLVTVLITTNTFFQMNSKISRRANAKHKTKSFYFQIYKLF